MSIMAARTALIAIVLTASGPASAAALTVPFDFSRHAIELTANVKGKPLHVLLDTGVNPSVIDLGRATALGLPLDRKAAGQGNGEGGKTTAAIPTVIPSPNIGGHDFGNVEALATDLRALSKSYGRPLDGVFGYSFLSTNTVLIDYPSHTLTIRPERPDLAPRCRQRYDIPFTSNDNDQFPVIRNFRFGGVEAPVTLDTGSNRMIGLYRATAKIAAIRNALVVKDVSGGSSFGGSYTTRNATLKIPFGIGPFMLPGGQDVSVMPGDGIPGKRVANVGNGFLAAVKAKLLIDYPNKRLALFGDCATSRR